MESALDARNLGVSSSFVGTMQASSIMPLTRVNVRMFNIADPSNMTEHEFHSFVANVLSISHVGDTLNGIEQHSFEL